MFDITLVYIHSQTPNYIRVHKNLRVFSRFFREVHYIGCLRGNRWGADRRGNVFYHIYREQLPHGPHSIYKIFGFYAYIKKCIIAIKPQLVIATNEDYLLPFILGYIERPQYLICDLIDSLAIRINSPLRIINPFLRRLSKFLLKRIDALIEVSDERLLMHQHLPKHYTVIYNTPYLIKRIRKYPGIKRPAIYVSGSMVDKRSGLEILLQAVEQLPHIRIIFAGRYAGDWIKNVFLKHPQVEYLGELSPEDSLRVAKTCNAIFAYYAPYIPNFVYAAPNKLYDAMMLGVPILMNSECRANEVARKAGIGLISPYNDVFGLKNNLEYVLKYEREIKSKCIEAGKYFKNYLSWERMEERYINLFKSMKIPECRK